MPSVIDPSRPAVYERDPADPAPPPAPAPTPDPPPEARYITREELAQQNEALLARIGGLVEGLAARPAAAPAAAPEPTFDLDALDQSLREGREGSAKGIDALIEARVNAGVRQALSAVDNLGSVGLSNMEAIAKAHALAAKPQEHVKRYGKELDAFMKTVAPEARANPEAWNRAYAFIIGQHHEELVREETERALRADVERNPDRGRSAGRGPLEREDGTKVPSVEEYAGAEGVGALREKGIRDGDEYAKRRGYENWQGYYDKVVAPYSETIDEYKTPKQLAALGFENWKAYMAAKTSGKVKGA
jgi:hypothetical protein